MNRSTRRHATSLLKKSCLSVIVAFALTANVNAQESAQQADQYAIPSGDLIQVVNEISRSSGVQIVYDIELLRGKQAAEVRGAMTLEQALDTALSGSGLSWARVNPTTISISKQPAATKPPKGKAKASSAGEPQASERHEVKELEKLVVVGSRLGVSPIDSAMPIKVITRDQIDQSGAGSIAQVLSLLPEVSISNDGDTPVGNIGGGSGLSNRGVNETNATTVQLRGLPFGTTLILINGRRSGESSALLQSGQFDLSTIPLSMVERIEVLPAGSSAVYGGDGLAGVINIVLRRDANGAEFRFRRAASDGYGESQASLMWGKSWSKGALTAIATWRKNSSLDSAERRLTADRDYRRFGGFDRRFAGFSNPGVVYSLAGCDLSIGYCDIPLEDRGNLPGLDSPFATVPTGQNGTNLSPQDFLGTAGIQALSSEKFTLVSPETNKSLSINGSFEVNQSIGFFGEFMYSKRTVPARQMWLSLSGVDGSVDGIIPASNPYNPFGVDVGVDYYFKETGIFQDFEQNYWRALAGANGEIGDWTWEATAWRSEDESSTGDIFTLRIPVSALSTSDPALAFNPFVGDGSSPVSADVLSSFVMRNSNRFVAASEGFNGYFRGSVGSIHAGDVIALVGAEYQRVDLESKIELLQDNDVSGGDESRAIFTEARVPLLAGRDGVGSERLALTGAFRLESTDRADEKARTEAFGLEYRPTKRMLLRATHSTAFKPLTIYGAIQPARVSSCCASVSDPRFNGDVFYVGTMYGGGIPHGLKPESSENRTFGVVLLPSVDWRIALTGWTIDMRDRLAYSHDLQFFVDNENELPGRVMRDEESGIIEIIDGRQFNIAQTEVSGIDFSIDGRIATAFGDFNPSLAATYVAKHVENVTDISPETNNLGVKRYTSWSPKWKVVPRLAWAHSDEINASVVGRYVSSYEDPQPLSTGPSAGKLQRLGSFWMFDVNVELSLGKMLGFEQSMLSDMRLSVGSTNVFNRLPDFCNFCAAYGYDASQYQVMGRKVYAEVRVGF